MVPSPRAAVVSTWSTDPKFRTAYSYLRPGGTPQDRRLLGEAVAKGLYLAGEATSVSYPGTMHGAWLSGERAAGLVEEAERAATVVVVGAGLAGLAAARRMRDGGSSVVVVEAGREVGGRVRADYSLGGPVHLGAAWIHGNVGNPVAGAAEALGIRTEPSHWGRGATFVAGHGSLTEAERTRLEAKRASIDAAIEAATAAGRPDQALGPVLRSEVARQADDALEFTVLDNWVRGIYENLYAAPVDDLSLLYAAEPFRMPGQDLTVLSGLDRLVAALAEGLDVRLDESVAAVRADGQRWRVVTSCGDHVAEAVIVTVPLGVLKAGSIAFDPPLPRPLQRSLAMIGAGRIGKLFLRFDEAFWQAQWSFWTMDPDRAPVQLWADASGLAGQPTLCGFFTATVASRLEAMSEAELMDVARSALAPMFGG